MVRSPPFSSRPGGVLSFTFFFSPWSCNIYTTRSNFESSDVLVSGVPISHFVYNVDSCISFISFLFFVLFSFRKDLQAEAPADLRPTQGTVILHITFAAKQDQVGVLLLNFILTVWTGGFLENCCKIVRHYAKRRVKTELDVSHESVCIFQSASYRLVQVVCN